MSFTKTEEALPGDPRAIAAGKKGYQVLRLKGLDPYLVKQIEERGYRRGFADGYDKAKTFARHHQPQLRACASDPRGDDRGEV